MIRNLVLCLLFLLGSCTLVHQNDDGSVKSDDKQPVYSKNSFVNYPGSLCRPFIQYDDPAVVFVQSYSKEDKQWSRCTGTLIAGGFIVTAKHCLPGGIEKTQVFVNSSKPEIYFIKSSKLNDTALIKIKMTDDIEKIRTIEIAPSMKRSDVILGNIAGFGCASGEKKVWAVGRPAVAMIKVFPQSGDEKIFISGCVCHGDSGGPFLNENNELIGIISATYEDGQRGLAEDANKAIHELK